MDLSPGTEMTPPNDAGRLMLRGAVDVLDIGAVVMWVCDSQSAVVTGEWLSC